mmetsp:Transcript_31953/g.47031  ORF Transcript_31953/g.47031 Transcript_31953/m.47031 type:complete len:366 (+) Transcript_31953:61-1158(+)
MLFATSQGTAAGCSMTTSGVVFDAHNHVHLSMPNGVPPIGSLNSDRNDEIYRSHADNIVNCFHSRDRQSAEAAHHLTGGGDERDNDAKTNMPLSFHVRGIGLMSTQPRDFPAVSAICNVLCGVEGGDSSDEGGVMTDQFHAIPCFGVHPWFLHEAEADGAHVADSRSTASFWWEKDLRHALSSHPNAAVGEIGLDAIRYDPSTGELCTPMERQKEAFELQIRIATEMQRTVSVHAVQAWGPMMDILNTKLGKKKGDKPPCIYFHAFGGKASVVDQLNAACRPAKVYYGFAPFANFRSPKTADVARKIGIDRLVLETDYENYLDVRQQLELNVLFLAKALDMDPLEVMKTTRMNAMHLYGTQTNQR